MDLSHPLRVALYQIVIDRHHVHALSRQGVQIGGQCHHQRLSFTGTHLRDASLMENNAADELYLEVFHVQHAPGGLPHRGIGLGEQVVKRLPLRQPLFEFRCLRFQLFIGQLHHLRPQRLDLFYQGRDPLQFSLAVGAKYLIDYLHSYSYLSLAVYQNPILYCTRFVQCIQYKAAPRYEYFINNL